MALQKVHVDYIEFGTAAANQVIVFDGANVVWGDAPTPNLAGFVTNTDLIANLAPYVNTAQLASNLVPYVLIANLAAEISNNTANNTLNLGGVPAATYVTSNGTVTVTGQYTFANSPIITGLVANGSTGLAGQALLSNGTSTYWGSSGTNTGSTYTWANTQTFNGGVVLGNTVTANGTTGTAGQYLASNGSATYWTSDAGGTITQVNTGIGLTGGPISTNGTISILANTGIIANATGLFVDSTTVVTNSQLTTVLTDYTNNSLLTANLSTTYTNAVNYAYANTQAFVTSQAFVNTAQLTSNLVFYAKSVNGISPSNTGNIPVSLTEVLTGTNSGRPATSNNGVVYVVSGDANTALNGDAYISNGTIWAKISGADTAANDARYLQLVGMIANVATAAANSATYVLANSGIVSNSSGVFVNANTGLVANGSGLFIDSSIYSNTSQLDTAAATAYSNAVSIAATDATNKAANAYSNAIAVAATAYSNAVSVAATDATTKAGIAYTNAIAIAATDATTKAGTAYSNAITAIATSTANNASNFGGLAANSGTAGQVLTSNGVNAPYWSTISGGGSTNSAAAFVWTNTHTFNANLVANGIIANGSLGTGGQVLASNGTSTYWTTVGGSGTVTNIASGAGLSGGPITGTGTLSVLANTGIIANSTGLFVDSTLFSNTSTAQGYAATAYSNAITAIATSTANNASNFGGLAANSGTAGQVLTSNGVNAPYWSTISGGGSTNSAAAFVWTNTHTFNANLVANGIIANGSLGTGGQVLASNGTSTYWTTVGGSGTVTNIASGAGLSGGPITGTGTLSVLANTGIIANSTGLFVDSSSFPNTSTAQGYAATAYSNAIAIAATDASTKAGTAYSNAISAIATSTANSATYVLANSGIVSNSSGVFVNANTGLVANSGGLFVDSTKYAALTGATFTGNVTANGIIANSSIGLAGQLLASNGSSSYWEDTLTVGATSITVNGSISSTKLQVSAKTADYTLTAADSGTVLTMSSTSLTTVTVPASLPVGFRCMVYKINTGNVVIGNAAGVTLNSRNGNYTCSNTFGSISVFVYASGSVVVEGVI